MRSGEKEDSNNEIKGKRTTTSKDQGADQDRNQETKDDNQTFKKLYTYLCAIAKMSNYKTPSNDKTQYQNLFRHINPISLPSPT